MLDMVIKNARLLGRGAATADLGIFGTRITAIEPSIASDAPSIDVAGRLVTSSFVETHIHLDKSCILDRCNSIRGDLTEAIAEAAKAKIAFTPEDVYARAARTFWS